MRVIYVADDGTTFDDEWDCKDYEFRRSLSLDDIEIYDENGNRFDDILSEDAYNNCTRVIVKTDKAVTDLHKIVKYTGFIYYDDIDSPGIWNIKIEDIGCTGFEKEEKQWIR